MTEAQIKLLADLRSGDLVSRAEVLRVLKRLGGQDADLALYGAEDNARAREYGEAAMTRACCAVAIMPASPDLSASLAEMIEGLVGASLHHETGERITRKDLNNAYRMGQENGRLAAELLPALARASDSRVSELQAENEKLRAALEPFAQAADIKLCGGDDHWTDDKRIQGTDVGFHITFGDLRRARALAKDHPNAEG